MGKITETIDFLNRTDFQGLSQEKVIRLLPYRLKKSAKKQKNNV
jgi:hypothetical protein